MATMDLATLETLVRGSKALSEHARVRLLEVAPRLKPTDWAAIAGHLQAADAKVVALNQKTATRQQAINQQVKVRGGEILHRELPRLVKAMEAKDRSQEEASLEHLLADLT